MTNQLILQLVSRLLLPVSIIFSIYLLWRGHNEPGGGFVGGLIAAAGFTIYSLPRGQGALASALVVKPQSIAGTGVLFALCSGTLSMIAGEPFLTHQWLVLPTGLVVGTPLVFDIGVYLVVLGAVLTFLSYYLEV